MNRCLKEIFLKIKDCEVICPEDLDKQYLYEKNGCMCESPKGYLFNVNNVICLNCSFTFVSQCFNEIVLTEYYVSSEGVI